LTYGFTSSQVAIDSSVRQGCLRDPFFFTCVVEPLSCSIRNCCIYGIPLSSHYSLNYRGYANNTATYFNDLADLPILIQIQNTFAKYFELKVNTHKSLVVSLGNTVIEIPPPSCPFKWLDASSCKWLPGVNILLDPEVDHN
jgi:hypothetical protein